MSNEEKMSNEDTPWWPIIQIVLFFIGTICVIMLMVMFIDYKNATPERAFCPQGYIRVSGNVNACEGKTFVCDYTHCTWLESIPESQPSFEVKP